MPFVPVPFAAPTYNNQQSADRVIDLMLRQGDVAAQGARAQGGIWGNAVQNLGGQAAHYLDQRQQQQEQQQKSQAINQVLTSWDGTDSLDLMKKLAAIPGLPPDAAVKIANGTTGMVKLAQAPEKMDWEAFHHVVGGLSEGLDQAGPEGIAQHWGSIKAAMDPYVTTLIKRPLGDQPNPEDIALIHGYDQRFNKQAKSDDAKPGTEAWFIKSQLGDRPPTKQEALQLHEQWLLAGKTPEKSLTDKVNEAYATSKAHAQGEAAGKPKDETTTDYSPDAEMSSSGSKYLDVSKFVGKERNNAQDWARKNGVKSVSKEQATTLQGVKTATANTNDMMDQLESKLPKDASGRIIYGTENKLSQYFQTDEDLAAFGSWRSSVIGNLRALGLSGRINKQEIEAAVAGMPQITDTLAVAHRKVANVLKQFANAEKSILGSTGAPSGPPSPAAGSPGSAYKIVSTEP